MGNNELKQYGHKTLGIYVNGFPDPSNTYVVNELVQMLKRGLNVKLYTSSLLDIEMFPQLHTYIDRKKLQLIDIIEAGVWKWSFADEHKIPMFDNRWKQKMMNEPVAHERWWSEHKVYNGCAPAFKEFAKMVIDHGVQALYTPFAGTDATVLSMLSKCTGLPWYFFCHAQDLFTHMFDFTRVKLSTAAGIFCISEYNKKYILEQGRLALPDPRFTEARKSLPNKVHLRRVNHYQEPGMDDIRPWYEGFKYIYSAGRICEMKGYEHSLRAFKRVLNKFPDLHYIITGGGLPHDIAKIEDLIKELEIEDRVHLKGHVTNTDVISHIKGAEFTLLTSIITDDGDKEGLPTFFVESMFQSTPVIGTDYSGIPDIIEHGVNGMLCDPKAQWDIGDAMIKLLKTKENKPEEWDSMCKAARKTAESKFDNNANIEILLSTIFNESE